MINVTIDQIHAAQDHNFEALAHINSEMESRICQLARKIAGGSNRELVEDLEQDGRLALFEYLATFKGDNVATFFGYVSRAIAGAMGDSRKRMHRAGVSKDTAKRFERAVSIADGDIHEAERVAQEASIMGGPFWTLSPELAYAARLSYVGECGTEVYVEDESIDSPDMPTYEINFDAIAEAADAANEGGRPFTWQVAGRTLERSVKAPKSPEARVQVMDSMAAVSGGDYGTADLETLERATTSYRSTGLDDAFAILASRAKYSAPEAEGDTPSEISKRLSGERIGRVRSAVKEMPDDLRTTVQRVFGIGGGTAGASAEEIAEELGLHQDAGASVLAGAQDWVRRALNGETTDEGKACAVCHIRKPVSDFYVANPKTGTLRRNCKGCQSAKSLRTKSAPEHKRADNASYRARKAQQYSR